MPLEAVRFIVRNSGVKSNHGVLVANVQIVVHSPIHLADLRRQSETSCAFTLFHSSRASLSLYICLFIYFFANLPRAAADLPCRVEEPQNNVTEDDSRSDCYAHSVDGIEKRLRDSPHTGCDGVSAEKACHSTAAPFWKRQFSLALSGVTLRRCLAK